MADEQRVSSTVSNLDPTWSFKQEIEDIPDSSLDFLSAYTKVLDKEVLKSRAMNIWKEVTEKVCFHQSVN
jgi:hypothetical protein